MHHLVPRASTLICFNRVFKYSLPPLARVSNSSLLHPKYRYNPNPIISLNTNSRAKSTMGSTNGMTADKPVLFFDIDNCLYPRSAKVHDLMAQLIDEYFAKHLDIPFEEAVKLHQEYYTSYGLAIEGLVRHHQIDPLDYNAKVDDALPLEDVIKPNPELKALLEDIDKSKVRLWLFTNAYKTHGRRVVKLLAIEEFFDGLTFCDYGQHPLICKPDPRMYTKAMKEAGIERVEDCFFVDDSFLNCKNAKEFGWTATHLVEEGLKVPPSPASQFQIQHLRELRDVYPQFFKSKSA